jgi:hypothetical protein
MIDNYKKIAVVFGGLLVSACAQLHHVQVGDVDDRSEYAYVPFEVMVSETGVSVEEIGDIARAASRSPHNNDGGKIADAIAMFQMGPRTGNPVYNQRYAEKMIYSIYEKCPSGHITGLMSIRETRKYPVISGEIVKITGYCKKTKPGAKS